MTNQGSRLYYVWDAPTRWFHWINFVLVVLLLVSGFLFMYRTALQIEGYEAKAAIQTVHSVIGYGFATNLLVRLVWGFLGNRYARWRAVLPDGTTLRSLGAELRDLIARRPAPHLGRSAISRLSITVMFVLMLAQMGTGLFRAGADLYFPPLGGLMASYIAKPDVDPATITWRNAKKLSVPERYNRLRRAKGLAGRFHRYGAYLILAMIVIHITGVTLTEVRQNSGVVSAMFSGRKSIAGKVVDADETNGPSG